MIVADCQASVSPLLRCDGSPVHELSLKRKSIGNCALEPPRKRRGKGEKGLEKCCLKEESL